MKLCVVMTEGPGPTSQFVEVEDEAGRSIQVGTWSRRPDGLSVLTIDLETVARERWEAAPASPEPPHGR